jgi:predicted  nucleic acid-binding Zn-ribbon protein
LAIFHLSIKIISRGKGKSAVAAAAYRAGELIKSDYDGITHDFTRKGGIVHTEILLPANAPEEYANRAVLWNAVERTEKAENAQLSREVEFSLPRELSHEQNIALARDFVKRTFVDKGMIADICIHDNDDKPHAHVMLSMRPFNDDGTWGGKQKKEYILDKDGNKIYDPKKRQYKCRSIPSTDWNDMGNAEIWRAAWQDAANAELERLGFEARIDHRSYERQGVDILPSIKLGTAASQMEKRGIRTERGDINREIALMNKNIRQLRARMNNISDWLKEEAANPAPPTLYDVLNDILTRQGNSALARVKAGAGVLFFLTSNNINSFEDLEKKVNAMNGKLHRLSEDMKPVNRRIATLKEHLQQSDNFKEHRALKRQYDRLYDKYKAARNEKGLLTERKAKKALEAANDFYEANRAGMTLFDAADKYLRDVLQGRYDPKKLPPIDMWKRELGSKTDESNALYAEYTALKEETQKVERIKRSVAEILHSEKPEQEQTQVKSRKRDMEIG